MWSLQMFKCWGVSCTFTSSALKLRVSRICLRKDLTVRDSPFGFSRVNIELKYDITCCLPCDICLPSGDIPFIQVQRIVWRSQEQMILALGCRPAPVYSAVVKKGKVVSRSLPVENLLPQNVGSIINYLQ